MNNMNKALEILKEYSIEMSGNTLGLEDQMAMLEAWESDTPWYETSLAELKAKIAERDARLVELGYYRIVFA